MYNKFKQFDGQDVLIDLAEVLAVLPSPQGAEFCTLVMPGFQVTVSALMNDIQEMAEPAADFPDSAQTALFL